MEASIKLIRRWLREHGHSVATHGPISQANQDLFFNSNPQYIPETDESVEKRIQLHRQTLMTMLPRESQDAKARASIDAAISTLVNDRGYTVNQIRTWVYVVRSKGYYTTGTRYPEYEDLIAMIDADSNQEVNPFYLPELNQKQVNAIRQSKIALQKVETMKNDIEYLEKVSSAFNYQASLTFGYINKLKEAITELNNIKRGSLTVYQDILSEDSTEIVRELTKYIDDFSDSKKYFEKHTLPQLMQVETRKPIGKINQSLKDYIRHVYGENKLNDYLDQVNYVQENLDETRQTNITNLQQSINMSKSLAKIQSDAADIAYEKNLKRQQTLNYLNNPEIPAELRQFLEDVAPYSNPIHSSDVAKQLLIEEEGEDIDTTNILDDNLLNDNVSNVLFDWKIEFFWPNPMIPSNETRFIILRFYK
jgi:hypothetical protein